MTVTPAAKAGTGNILVAAATAIASENAARAHPKPENPGAAVLENSDIDPAVGHPVPVTGAWKAQIGGVRRRAKPALTAKVRNVLPNIGPRQQQLRYRLFQKRNASRLCLIH